MLDTGERGTFIVSLPSAIGFDHNLLAALAICPCRSILTGAILALERLGIWRMSDDDADWPRQFPENVG
jgi:hypothetical protein